jgi:hypothetical protein
MLVVWIDRALSGDDPLIVFEVYLLLLGFNFEFNFFSRGYWQPSGQFFTGYQRVLATLWSIFYRVSEGIGNSLTNS